MPSRKSSAKNIRQLQVLIVDDSLVFRRFLRDMFAAEKGITIAGEAENGIEALHVLLKVKPDVILMDMEMPLMDGMTALQHLMVHRPIPTIMFSSITNEGTARAFDVLKKGAVDFICKDFIFQEKHLDLAKKIVIKKVRGAAAMKVNTIEPMFDYAKGVLPSSSGGQRVVFCEECGARNSVEITKENADMEIEVACRMCGDILQFYDEEQRHKRVSFISVIGGGEGAIANVLQIIPRLAASLHGAMLIVLRAPEKQIDALADYLDAISSIKIRRTRDGMSFEGGYCYLAAASENVYLQPYNAHYTLQKKKSLEKGMGACDLAMASVAAVFKTNSAGILLSGYELDGIRGLATIIKHGGAPLLLEPKACLSQRLPKTTQQKCGAGKLYSADELIEKIEQIHSTEKKGMIAA